VISTLTACSLSCALVLSGCAPSNQHSTSGQGRDLTLADLKHRNVSVKPQELEPIAAEKVLATYEQAVALFSTQEERALALRRMADLTMVATEDSMIASLEESPLVDDEAAVSDSESLQYVKAVAIYEALILGAPLTVPAGKHGPTKADGASLVFEDGSPARFWGVNLAWQAQHPTEEQILPVVNRFRANGVNMVRLTYLDNSLRSPRNPGGNKADSIRPGKRYPHH